MSRPTVREAIISLELDGLVAEMQAENERDATLSEDADRRFHMLIAESTQNSAMITAVQMLWRRAPARRKSSC